MAKAAADQHDAEAAADAARAALLAAGAAPDAQGLPPALPAYHTALPAEVLRLAAKGQEIEEIRVALGFSEEQQAMWGGEYVDFAAAVARARELCRAFWLSQARIAVKAGDRSSFSAITGLIEKRYSQTTLGDAASLVTIRIPDV
jgi:hypothetical protein